MYKMLESDLGVQFIADADLRKYFGAADLIVQPYKTATQSGVTQVAFHFEKPCLVTNVGGLSWQDGLCRYTSGRCDSK